MLYKSLKQVGKIVTGSTPSTLNKAFYLSNDIPFFKPNDFSKKEINSLKEPSFFISEEARSKARIIPKNSVLVTCIGIIGKIGITQVESAFNQQINAIIPEQRKCNSRFLAYYFLTKQEQLRNMANAPVVPIINKTQFSNLQIPLPPLATQKKIADLLDTADELRNKTKAIIDHYDQLAQSLFLEMFGDPVSNPKGWEKDQTIKYCNSIVPGRNKPKSFSGNIPWVTTEDLLHQGFTNESSKNIGLTLDEINKVKAKIIPKNSVIMTCVGDLGIVTINTKEIVINQQLHAFQCKENMNPIFLMHSLSFQKPYFYKMASNTTVLYLNKTNCNNTPTINPPLPLQTQFAERIAIIEQQKELAKQSLQESEHLFNVLLQKAFKGEINSTN